MDRWSLRTAQCLVGLLVRSRCAGLGALWRAFRADQPIVHKLARLGLVGRLRRVEQHLVLATDAHALFGARIGHPWAQHRNQDERAQAGALVGGRNTGSVGFGSEHQSVDRTKSDPATDAPGLAFESNLGPRSRAPTWRLAVPFRKDRAIAAIGRAYPLGALWLSRAEGRKSKEGVC